MPASPIIQANQARVGRIVGFSLAGLWLAVSMLAGVASTLEADEATTHASASAEVTARVLPASN